MNSNILPCALAQNIAELLVTSWRILSRQCSPPDKCDAQKFLSPTFHCHSLSCPTPPSHQSKNLHGSSEEMAFYPNSSCCFTAPLCAVVPHRRSWCEAITGTHSRLFLHCWKTLHWAPQAMHQSRFVSLDTSLLKSIWLKWCFIDCSSLIGKKKVKNRLWMPINTVWELWVIRDIRFPADVFIP